MCVSVFNHLSSCCAAAFLPAQISMVGSSTVTEGDIFELQCTVDANMVQKHTECTHIRSYLMRNNTVVRMEAFSIKDTKATFAIQDATLRDSGQYSCVVFPSRCVREEDAKFRGNNTLTVHVEGLGSHCTFISFSVFQFFWSPWHILILKKSPGSPQTQNYDKMTLSRTLAHIPFKNSLYNEMLFVLDQFSEIW